MSKKTGTNKSKPKKKIRPDKKLKLKRKKKPDKKSVGRPTKLTKELIAEFKKYLELGNYAETVYQFLGVSKTSFYEWLARGNKDIEANKETLFSVFTDTITKARANATMRNVKLIHDKAGTDTHYATWWLERTNWQQWGKKEQLAIEEAPKKKGADLSELTLEEMHIFIYGLRKELAKDHAEELEAFEKLKFDLGCDNRRNELEQKKKG